MAKTAASDSHSSAQQLRDQAQVVKEDLRELGQHAKGAVVDVAHRAREQVGDTYDQGREKLRTLENGFEDYVRDNPLKSTLIAAGAGLVLGMFWSRR